MWLLRSIHNKFGWPGIGITILALTIISICNSYFSQNGYESSFKEPIVGDIYIIKKNGDYHAHRLKSVSKDSFCLQKPNYEIGSFEDKDINSLKANSYLFANDSLWMTRSELAGLLASEQLKIFH